MELLEEWLTVKDLAEKVGCSNSTIERYADRYSLFIKQQKIDSITHIHSDAIEVFKFAYKLATKKNLTTGKIIMELEARFPKFIESEATSSTTSVDKNTRDLLLEIADKLNSVEHELKATRAEIHEIKAENKAIVERHDKLLVLKLQEKEHQQSVSEAEKPHNIERSQSVWQKIIAFFKSEKGAV